MTRDSVEVGKMLSVPYTIGKEEKLVVVFAVPFTPRIAAPPARSSFVRWLVGWAASIAASRAESQPRRLTKRRENGQPQSVGKSIHARGIHIFEPSDVYVRNRRTGAFARENTKRTALADERKPAAGNASRVFDDQSLARVRAAL